MTKAKLLISNSGYIDNEARINHGNPVPQDSNDEFLLPRSFAQTEQTEDNSDILLPGLFEDKKLPHKAVDDNIEHEIEKLLPPGVCKDCD